jgi:hypothetical protein
VNDDLREHEREESAVLVGVQTIGAVAWLAPRLVLQQK